MKPHPPKYPSSDPVERRTSPRVPAAAAPHVKARLFTGPEVRLVNFSRRGVLLETHSRLLPDAQVQVKFVAGDAALVLKGVVVHCSVSTFGERGLVYRTAVAFDRDISLLDPELFTEAARQDAPPANKGTAHETPAHAQVIPLRHAGAVSAAAKRADTTGSAESATVLTLFAEDGADFRALFAANDW